MYGELSDAMMDQMLQRKRFGRLGFVLEGQVYIIPINYGYDGERLYGHAAPGTKTEALRQNAAVAFEIDEIEDPAHWRSVLLHGRFVELRDRAEKEAAFDRILSQAGGGERSQATWAAGLDNLVVFQIEILQRTGRFEHRQGISLGPIQRRP